MAAKVNDKCNKKSKEMKHIQDVWDWENIEDCDDEFKETESYFADPLISDISDIDDLNTVSGTKESPKKEEKKKKKKKIKSIKEEVRRLGLWSRYTEINYEDGERLIMYVEKSSPPEGLTLVILSWLYLFLTCFFVYWIAPLLNKDYSKSD